MTDRHYYRELKTGYQDFRVVAVVIRLSNPFFHHRAQKTILLVLHPIESSIKTAISEATVGLHKKIETQEKEISDLKAESSQI
jgi:hypothetical protein